MLDLGGESGCLPPIGLPTWPVGGAPREPGSTLRLSGWDRGEDAARPAFTAPLSYSF